MGAKLPQYPPKGKPSRGAPQVPPPPPPMNHNSRIAKTIIKKIHNGEPFIMVRPSITAAEALEMSGCQSEIDLINLDISQAAQSGQRHLYLRVEVMRSKWTDDITGSLRDRGFKIKEEANPVSFCVSW